MPLGATIPSLAMYTNRLSQLICFIHLLPDSDYPIPPVVQAPA